MLEALLFLVSVEPRAMLLRVLHILFGLAGLAARLLVSAVSPSLFKRQGFLHNATPFAVFLIKSHDRVLAHCVLLDFFPRAVVVEPAFGDVSTEHKLDSRVGLVLLFGWLAQASDGVDVPHVDVSVRRPDFTLEAGAFVDPLVLFPALVAVVAH